MKITKRQLRRIIKEEREQEIVKLVSARIPDVGFGDQAEEDFLAAKIELEEDGDATEQELSQLSFEKWQELKESFSMNKITKRQLRRIIREERSKLGHASDRHERKRGEHRISKEEEQEYDRGYADGYDGFPEDPAGWGPYFAGWEAGNLQARDEDEKGFRGGDKPW